MRDFSVIVNDCAVKAVAEAKELARAGNMEDMILYYRTGDLRLTAYLVTDNAGWKIAGPVLKSNVPYERYHSWVYKHAQGLPIFAD